MLNYIAIMAGGALGTGLRFWLATLIAARFGDAFPLGTLVVNVTGCFVAGAFATLTDPMGRFMVPIEIRQVFLIGVCGGFTTFSTFGLQTLALARDGDWLKAALNAGVSLILCLLAVWLGRVVVLAFVPR